MKSVASLFAAASVVAMPLSAVAQSTSAAAQEDLRCAAWAAMLSGELEEDPETANAFALMMTYFIGRYEGATGADISEAMTPAFVMEVGNDMEATSQMCLVKMEDLGTRMEGLGSTLMEAGNAG